MTNDEYDILSNHLAFIKRESRDKVLSEDKSLIDLARRNRRDATEAETVMWEILRGGFCGVRFRRQHVVAGFIADFACTTRKLIVEIDGGYHFTEEQMSEDAYRTEVLNRYGYTVMRFTNDDVLTNIDTVINRIHNYIIKELI